MADIAQQLSSFFKAQGITQEVIASQLGVSQQYVSGLLSGKKPFGKKQAQRFAELWGISPSWLLTGEGEMLHCSDNSRTIVNNTGIANNGDNAIVNPPAPSKELDTMLEMLKMKDAQIGELISQNGKLMTIIQSLTSK